MAETNLKRGDIVRLNSGSCLMTISEIKTKKNSLLIYIGHKITGLDINIIIVKWFWEGEIRSGVFYESQLKQVKAS